MKIGFTGTRAGMSPAQRAQLRRVLCWLRASETGVFPSGEFHHGAALGAATEASLTAKQDGWWHVVPHPADRDEHNELARNREIVGIVDILIAAPQHDAEERRSGTWATVRYARKAGKPVGFLSRGKEDVG